MRKLTLDQAANELGIKRDSVYKRTQRHTLPYTIEPDGSTYVYLDDEQATERASEEDDATQNIDGGNGRNNRSWWDTDRSWWDLVAAASGIAVLFGGLIYALGLFTLWVPIARTQIHDPGAAWHTAFLVPRAVVAGLGVRQLVAFPLISALLMIAWIVVTQRYLFRISNPFWIGAVILVPVGFAVTAYMTWNLTTGPGPFAQAPFDSLWGFVFQGSAGLALLCVGLWDQRHEGYKNWTTAGVVIGALVSWGVGYFYYWRSGIASNVQSWQTPSDLMWTLIDATSVVFAAAIIIIGAIEATEFLELGSRPPLLRMLIVVMPFVFIGAFLLTVPSTPPLPRADIDVKGKEKDVGGVLLTHAEGYWYVFEAREGQPTSRLTAIPDDEIRTAWVSKRPE